MADEDGLDNWRAFCAVFDKAVANCAENGSSAKLTVDFGSKKVTVEVYREKGDMRKLEEILKGALAAPKVSTAGGG